MPKYTKEEARNALKIMEMGKGIPQVAKDLFQAVIDETLPQFYLGRLLHLRYDLSDELPEPDVPKDHPDYKELRLEFRVNNPQMKCRGNYIVSISLTLQSVIGQEVLTAPEYVDLVEEYKTRKWNAFRGAKGEYWTLPEEIQLINSTLETVIAGIKDKYGL